MRTLYGKIISVLELATIMSAASLAKLISSSARTNDSTLNIITKYTSGDHLKFFAKEANLQHGPVLNETERHVLKNIIMALPKMRKRYKDCESISLINLTSTDATALVHFVRFSKNPTQAQMDFVQFMSILSVERFLQPRLIIIWANHEPSGFYYKLLQQHIFCLKWQPLQPPSTIGNKTVIAVTHLADYVKLRKVYKYGGVALDYDLAVVNGTKLKQQLQKRQECVFSCEYYPVQEVDLKGNCSSLNLGALACYPKSEFVASILRGYKHDYRPELFLYNSNYYGISLLKRNPALNKRIILDNTISAYPIYSRRNNWLKPDGVPHWKSKTMAHYYFKRIELSSKSSFMTDFQLVFMNNSLGELYRHVLSLSSSY